MERGIYLMEVIVVSILAFFVWFFIYAYYETVNEQQECVKNGGYFIYKRFEPVRCVYFRTLQEMSCDLYLCDASGNLSSRKD
jgi:uncharacterized protein YggT (Ycf19 family)